MGNLHYNIAFTYRAWESYAICEECHHEHADHDHDHHDHGHHDANGPSLDVVLEFNGVWQAKQLVAGVRDNNSGGNIIYVAPGARLNFGHGYSIFVSAGLPVLQDANGFAHESDFRLIVGASLVH